MMEIYETLRASWIPDHTGEQFQFLYWNRPMTENQRRARNLMDQCIEIVTRKNPLISRQSVYEKLLFRVVQEALYHPRDMHNVKSEIEQATNELFDFYAQREIDIPIVYLDVGAEPTKFGLATFYNMTDKDFEESWLANFHLPVRKEFLKCYARVIALGDLETAREDADKIVDDMLTYMRAVGFPVSTKPQVQFGVLNDYPSSQGRPYRSSPPTQNHRLEAAISYSWRLGPGLAPYNIRSAILQAIDSSTLDKLQLLIENNYRKPQTETKRKFLLGLRWLGEATKPDTTESRFVKLAFSLEALIGGESKQDYLTTRGLTATLAEREWLKAWAKIGA